MKANQLTTATWTRYLVTYRDEPEQHVASKLLPKAAEGILRQIKAVNHHPDFHHVRNRVQDDFNVNVSMRVSPMLVHDIVESAAKIIDLDFEPEAGIRVPHYWSRAELGLLLARVRLFEGQA